MAQLGLAHTDTLLTKGNLAILLKQLGSGRRRSGCSRRMVVAGQTAQPRLDHTSNLATKDNLVVLLEDMEERAEAAVQSAAGGNKGRALGSTDASVKGCARSLEKRKSDGEDGQLFTWRSLSLSGAELRPPALPTRSMQTLAVRRPRSHPRPRPRHLPRHRDLLGSRSQ